MQAFLFLNTAVRVKFQIPKGEKEIGLIINFITQASLDQRKRMSRMKNIERKGAEKSYLRLSLGQWVPLLEEGKILGPS